MPAPQARGPRLGETGMIPALRGPFNRQFSPEKYQEFLRALEAAVGTTVEFRVCETPVFLPRELLAELQTAATEIMAQLYTPEYLQASLRAVPAAFRVPNDDEHPVFLAIDFAITLGKDEQPAPRLIELQGFPSLRSP